MFIKFHEMPTGRPNFAVDGKKDVGIYALVDPRDRTIRYIGASRRPNQRLSLHKRHPSRAIKEWMEQIYSTPDLEVLDWASVERWQEAEQEWIAWVDYYGDLYNRHPGGCLKRDGVARWPSGKRVNPLPKKPPRTSQERLRQSEKARHNAKFRGRINEFGIYKRWERKPIGKKHKRGRRKRKRP